jgi:hypothetical protein
MATTPTPSDEFDFGFSFADDDSLPSPAVQTNNEELTALQAKVDSLLDSQTRILEDKMTKLLEDKYKAKLREVENLIMPLLANLKKNPEKAYIHWPNRGPIIDKQIEKITAITRG